MRGYPDTLLNDEEKKKEVALALAIHLYRQNFPTLPTAGLLVAEKFVSPSAFSKDFGIFDKCYVEDNLQVSKEFFGLTMTVRLAERAARHRGCWMHRASKAESSDCAVPCLFFLEFRKWSAAVLMLVSWLVG